MDRFRHPALRVSNGGFSDPPPEWRRLEPYRERIQARLPSVGRIRQGSFVLGTGVLVAHDVVMTNRHVAQSFASDIDGVPKIRVGWQPMIDFIGEAPLASPSASGLAETACERCRIRRIRWMHSNEAIDLALLDVAFDDTQGPEQSRRPHPMALNTSRATLGEHRPIYLVGFPTQDSTVTADNLQRVLGAHVGVKRVQPGFITRVGIDDNVFEFEHDASTMTGNSGSCVIDLEANALIGLHGRTNRAMAFSLLPPDALRTLREAGIDITTS